MFLIDDVVMSPFRGILAIFREIHNAVMLEAVNEQPPFVVSCSQLYLLLNTGTSMKSNLINVNTHY